MARKQRPLMKIPERVFMLMARNTSGYFGDEKSFFGIKEFF
jgi:hypothetical protein